MLCGALEIPHGKEIAVNGKEYDPGGDSPINVTGVLKPVRDHQSVCGPSFINWLDWRFLCGQCQGIFLGKFIYAQPWAIP